MLHGKNAIVTGAGSGIGLAILKRFVGCGANVWALVHDLEPAVAQEIEADAKENGVWVKTIEFDLFDEDSVKGAIKQIIAEKQNIDILVNCAGIVHAKTLGMTAVDDMKQSMTANFLMPSLIMQLVSRKMMRQNSGAIVNIISRAAEEYRSGAYAYGSSKMALLWGTKALAKELGQYQIRVNGISPGLTETNLGTARLSEEGIAEYVARNNIKRPAKPAEIADAVLYLVSDMSSYVSGQILNIDGGRY